VAVNQLKGGTANVGRMTANKFSGFFAVRKILLFQIKLVLKLERFKNMQLANGVKR
jgi:hypothetical protein